MIQGIDSDSEICAFICHMRHNRYHLPGRKAIYHCVSKVTNEESRIDTDVAEKIYDILKRVSFFTGVEVLSWSILPNHFHLVVQTPKHRFISDEVLMERVRVLYAGNEVKLKEYKAIFEDQTQGTAKK